MTHEPPSSSPAHVLPPHAARPARRRCLVAGASLLAAGVTGLTGRSAAAAEDVEAAIAALKAGGAVVAFRHALAPGTFDPPEFRLGDCSTQRNLSDEGRAQARRLGAWMAARGLQPVRVRSSPWCRCIDTAQAAFGRAEAWPALGSPRAQNDDTARRHLDTLRAALVDAGRRASAGSFEAWVTHMFVLQDLVGQSLGSSEGVVLRAGPDGRPTVVGRIPPV